MKLAWLGLILMGMIATQAQAQAPIAPTAPPDAAQVAKDAANYRKARQAVADLEKISAPSGIQETYKTTIGGVDQWLNVRGQDREQ